MAGEEEEQNDGSFKGPSSVSTAQLGEGFVGDIFEVSVILKSCRSRDEAIVWERCELNAEVLPA